MGFGLGVRGGWATFIIVLLISPINLSSGMILKPADLILAGSFLTKKRANRHLSLADFQSLASQSGSLIFKYKA